MKPPKILLIDPMPRGSLQPPFPVLPLGIACIASIAQSMNGDVRVLWGQDLEQPLKRLLAEWQPDCAGFQTFVNNISLSHRFAQVVRAAAPNAFIALGGVQASNDPALALEAREVDAVITGEGEMQFRLLLERIGNNPYETPGLVYRDADGQITQNSGKCLFENLDDLPDIPYELFYGKGPVPVGHLLTHRGCPFHCSHCPLKFRTGVPIRSHSADRIIAVVQHLQTTFGIRHIEFLDENFTMDHDHVRKICQGIAPLNITFSCTARISQVSPDLCRDMADAGCNQIIFGLGTGVPRLQTILGTHENLDHARDLMAQLDKTAIRPVAVFSMGIPTESRREFRQTVRFAARLHNCHVRFEPAAPLPGSPLHKTAQESGRFLIRTWNDYVRPNQIVYLPEGWSIPAFYAELYRAKFLARLKRAGLY